MGSNSNGSLNTTDKVRNGIFDVLDPGHLLTTDTKDTSRPAYEEALNQYNANAAMHTGNLLSSGFTAYPDGAGNSFRYTPLESGLSGAQLLGLNADPNSGLSQRLQTNSPLAAQSAYGNQFASGAAGQQAAQQNGTAAAIGQAGAAAGGIATAGRTQAGAANMSAILNQGQLDDAGRDLNVIRNSALGNGPSAAENLARSHLDQNIQAQAALAASARGGNIAAAQRGAMMSGQNLALQSTSQLAAQRAQEQLNAQQLMVQGNTALASGQNQLTAARGALRGQDIAQAQAGAQAQQGVAGLYGDLNKTQAGVQVAGLSSLGQGANTTVQQNMGANQAEQAARDAYTQFLLKQYSLQNGIPVNDMNYQVGQRQLDQQQDAANKSAIGGIVAGLIA